LLQNDFFVVEGCPVKKSERARQDISLTKTFDLM